MDLIKEYISLKDKSWFNTGGLARFWAEPVTQEQFANILKWANNNSLNTIIIGEGANILVTDNTIDSLVIKPKLKNIYDLGNNIIEAEAGVVFGDLINWCLNNKYLGLEEFSGIPGSVGGSVYINIHYFEFLLSNYLVGADLINKTTGEIISVDNNWFNFGYNKSKLQEKLYYLVRARFRVNIGSDLEVAYSKGRSYEIIRYRKTRYPNKNTCGSFFRNFYPEEVTLESAGKKMIYIAYYLDKLGIKGELSVGGALVSHQHANMIINYNNSSSQDIINLVKKMQELVYNKYSLVPQPECQLIGFSEYPFYK